MKPTKVYNHETDEYVDSYVTEPSDIEQALKVIGDAKMMFDRRLINTQDFLRQYTIISDDNLYFLIDKVNFKIRIPIASVMKYGGEYIVKLLYRYLTEQNTDGLVEITINPK